ncbi:MAG TPA: DUF4189 domain-containing protein [Longimicrobium sp.]|nr:DUF4189 domain-containing protein [Longimicrobium sp.]
MLLAAAMFFPSRAAAQAEAMPSCIPAREYDRAVVDSVSRQLRAAMTPRYGERQIQASIAAAVERLRATGRIACMDGAGSHVEASLYGALALGSGQAWGASWDHPTQSAADARAREECGEGCTVVLRVVGPTCGAYATRGSTYGWGTGPDRAQAENRALAECAARTGGRRCSVQVWGCNSRP